MGDQCIKVLFIARSTLFSSPGGDTKQVEQTASYLRKLGIDVDVCLAKDDIDYAPYDLLHFFNIIRPADIIYHSQKSQKPFVISTNFLDYGAFEKNNRRGLMGLLNKILDEDFIEYLKVIARYIKNGEPVKSRHYLVWGHRRSVKYLIRHASLLLPNSNNEYQRLVQKYGESQNYEIIPNAVDCYRYRTTSDLDEKYKDAVLCVGRVEGRKNQLSLIRALKNTRFNLVIHGKHSPNNRQYYLQCRKEADGNVRFNERVSEEELFVMFNSARVHVLPSFFETTGLSSLEAAVMGCNIVITDKGDTVEYFGDMAYYCNPEDPSSIRNAIEKAYREPFKEELRRMILKNYTWDKAAQKTLEAYQRVLV